MLIAAVSLNPFARLDVRGAIDILIIAVLVYYLLNLMRGTRALQMTVAILLLLGIYESARWAQFEMVEWLLAALLPYVAIALIVLFQPEIRRALARLGRNLTFTRFPGSAAGSPFDDVVLAASYFSQNRIGALITFERDAGLHTYIESGIALDAHLSHDLLLAIFRPGSSMHDGAAIIQGTRVAAAACFLPLSLNPAISNQLGSRHRAAIGVTEESDAIAVVVSEQTGAISLAVGGAIEVGLTAEQLGERLEGTFRRFRVPMTLPAQSSGTRIAGKN
jgi:diadenylate cyclase